MYIHIYIYIYIRTDTITDKENAIMKRKEKKANRKKKKAKCFIQVLAKFFIGSFPFLTQDFCLRSYNFEHWINIAIENAAKVQRNLHRRVMNISEINNFLPRKLSLYTERVRV